MIQAQNVAKATSPSVCAMDKKEELFLLLCVHTKTKNHDDDVVKDAKSLAWARRFANFSGMNKEKCDTETSPKKIHSEESLA